MEDGECDVTCGGGFQNWKREVSTASAHGGPGRRPSHPAQLQPHTGVGLTSTSEWISSGRRTARCVATSPPTELPTTQTPSPIPMSKSIAIAI